MTSIIIFYFIDKTMNSSRTKFTCMFCRVKRNDQGTCPSCIEGFRDWIEENISFKVFFPREMILIALSCILRKGANNNFEYRKSMYRKFLRWPGFYCGDNNWVVPKLETKIVCDEELNINNGEDILVRLLSENNINIFDNIQIENFIIK